ncbi:MAG: hypothetical protein JWQ57_3705 [Mucilaginibacter sp.]|nr:hypothetical protein [Mucilaginibacter sp.]
MKTIVRYEFDNHSFFPKGYTGPTSVKFTDPAVIPATGDKVYLRMEELFNDAGLISHFEEYSDGLVYFAERLNTIIGKHDTEVIIVLYEEPVFKEHFPRFFAGELAG